MAVLLGSIKRRDVVYKFGKPYKEGKLWAQDIVEFIDGKMHKATNYAYKKSIIDYEHKNYPYLRK